MTSFWPMMTLATSWRAWIKTDLSWSMVAFTGLEEITDVLISANGVAFFVGFGLFDGSDGFGLGEFG